MGLGKKLKQKIDAAIAKFGKGADVRKVAGIRESGLLKEAAAYKKKQTEMLKEADKPARKKKKDKDAKYLKGVSME